MREDERELDFSGVLAALQALIGSRVVVEASADDGRVHQESAGILERSIDVQVEGPGRSVNPRASRST